MRSQNEGRTGKRLNNSTKLIFETHMGEVLVRHFVEALLGDKLDARILLSFALAVEILY